MVGEQYSAAPILSSPFPKSQNEAKIPVVVSKLTVEQLNRVYDYVDHHIDTTSYYAKSRTLFKIRVVMFLILAANWSSGIFKHGLGYFINFAFYTIWNETFVFLYFFCLLLTHPSDRNFSGMLVSFQHQVVTSQTIVVIVFWGILAPGLGLNAGAGYYVNCYKHSVPFLCILHECLVTYGRYNRKGILLCMAIFVIYMGVNIVDVFAFNFVAYPTPLTDPRNWQAYILLPFNLAIVYFAGAMYLKLKRRICVSHYLKDGASEEVMRIINGSGAGGASKGSGHYDSVSPNNYI
jgi:hypothetical protein